MGEGQSKGNSSATSRKPRLDRRSSVTGPVSGPEMTKRRPSLPSVLEINDVNPDPKGTQAKWKNETPIKSPTGKVPPATPKKPAPGIDHERKPAPGNDYEKYPGKRIVVALYGYSSDTPGDLTFNKGDRLVVLREEDDWCYAKHLRNLLEGYVPGNYVVVEKSLDSYDWYHGDITRIRAEKDLHAPGNIRYTFLIRDSSSADGSKSYALSVLDEDDNKTKTVRHYRVRSLSGKGGFFLTTTSKFSTLEELVKFYWEGQTGEAGKMTLSRPCAKARPTLYALSKDKWEISRGELEFKCKLGEGKFGEVHQGCWRNKPVAIKTLKDGSMDPAKFLDEAKIMKQLRHRKLVALYAVCSTQQPFYIVTELMSNGCLLTYLRNDRGRLILLPSLIDIAGQVADGMMFIETKGYIHRDLAARNILVGDHNHVKIGDFGLAMAAADALQVDRNEKFPVKWTAPESMRESRFSIKSDVWSFGILLVELMTYGDVPYPDKTNKETVAFVESGNRHSRPPLCPDVVHDLMLNCWKRNPNDRPTFESLYGAIEDIAIDQGTSGYQ